MRVPSTPIILTAAALSLAGNVASSTTSANGNNTAAPSTNSSSTAPSSTMAASSSVATISSSSSISSSQVDKASTAETGSSSATPSASSVAASSSVSLSPATTSGKPARREVASPQVSNRIQSRFNRERYVIRSPSPKSDAVQAAADQSGDASPQPKSEMGGEYEAWEEAAGRKQKHQEHGKRDVMEAWEAASRHGSSNRWKRDGASLQARGLIKVRSKGLASSLDGRSTTAPLQEADKSKDKPKPKPVTKPKEVPMVAEEEALEDEDLDLTGEDGDDEADVASILEDRRRSLTASARRGSVNRLNLNGRRSKPSSRRGSFEEVGSEDDDSNSDSNSSPSAISSAHRRHNIKRLLDLQLGGGGKVNGHAHASTSPSVEDDDEDCEADDESVDQSSHISLSTRDEPDEEGDVTEEVEDKVPTKGSASTSFPKAVNVPADAASPLSPTLADLKWQDEQLQIAIKAIETLDGVGTTTGRKAKSGGYKKQKRDENIQSTMQDLSPVTDPATSMVSPFESSLPAQAQAPNPFASIPQESYTTEQQADINSLIKGLKGYGGAQSSWFMPGGQLPTVASAMSPLAGPIDSLPSGSGNRAQAQAQLQQALSVLGYANNPNALAGYLSQMGMVGQGQSPEQMAQGLLSQVSNLGNSQPFSSIQSQLGLGGLTSQQQNLLNSLGISKEAQSQLMSMGIGNLASQQSQLPISQLQQGFSSAGLDQQRQQLLNILQSQSLGNFEGMRSMGQMSSLGMSNGSPNPLSSMMNSLGTSGGSATSSQLNSLAGSAFTPTAQQLQGLSPSQLASLSYAATGPMRFMAGSSNGTASNSTMSSNATMSNDTMSMSLSSNTTMPSNSTVMPTNSSMPGPGGNGTGKRSFGQLPSSLSPEQLSQLQGLLQSQMGSVPNLGQYNPALGGVQQSLSPAQAQAVVSALSSLAGNANGIAGGDQLSLSQLKALQSQLQNGALAGTPAGGLISSLFGNLPLKLNALGQTTPNFPASGQLKVEDSKPTSSKSSEAAKETDSSSSTWSYSEWTTVMPSSMSSTDNRWPAPTNTSTSMTSNATPTSDTDADRVALGDGNKYAWSWSSSGTESSTSVASASPSPSEVALGTGNRYSWTWSADDAEKNSNLMSRWYNRKREDSKESDLISEEPQTVTVTKTVTPTSTPSMTKSKMHHSKTKTPSPTSSGSSKDKQGEDGADVEVEVMEDHSSSSKKHHKSSSLSSSASEPTSEGGAKKLVASASSNSTATSSTKSPCPSHSGDHGHPTLAAGQMSLPSGMVPYPDA